jgi:histidinol-phosphatase
VGGVSAPSLHPALAAAVDAARAAGEIALQYYRGGFEVTIKPDQTPVTQADREAERAITAVLGRAFPEWGFLGEEFGQSGPTETRWIIDPIDGTKNFVRGIPFWAVLIGLEERGEVTTGVVFNPVTDELFTARRGDGAYRNGERLRVSDYAVMKDATVLHAGLRLLRERGHWDGFVRLFDAGSRTRGFGDYYGYGLVAAGKAELYVEVDLKPWDIAAVKILVEEAGGRLTDFSGRPTIYDGTVLASNGRLHDEALRLLGGR